MPMQWQQIGIPLSGGVETKTDPKAVPPTKLLRLENGIFTENLAIRKRHGYTALSNDTIASAPTKITAGKRLTVLGDELVLLDGAKAYSYADNQDGWLDRGALDSLVATQEARAHTGTNQIHPDCATLDGVTVYAWEDSRGTARMTVIDATTGTVLDSDRSLGNNTSRPRVRAVGTQIHVYVFDSTDNTLKLKRIAPTDVPGTVGGALIAVASNIAPATPHYDVAVTATMAFVVYATTTANTIGMRRVEQTGVPYGGLVTLTATGAITTISCAIDANEIYLGVAYTIATKAYAFIYKTAGLVSHVGDSNIDGTAGACGNVTCTWESGTLLRIFYEQTAASSYNYKVSVGALQTDGTITSGAVLLRHSGLASRAFTYSGAAYVNVVYATSLYQTTYFLARADKLVVGRFLPGTAGGLTTKPTLSQVETRATGRFAWMGVSVDNLDTAGPGTATTFPEKGLKEIVLDWSHAQVAGNAVAGGALYVAGGILWEYDGREPVEAGFLLFPDMSAMATPSQSTAGGSVSVGSHGYLFRWEWKNERGEREQSGAVPTTVVVGADKDTVTFAVPTIAHTNKDVHLAAYRTILTGMTYYRISDPDPATAGAANGYLANDTTADTVSFVDKMSDATLATQELDYGNAEDENVPAEPVSIIVAGQNRLWLAGFEDTCEVRCSKLRFWGTAIAFTDQLRISVPETGGAVTGLGFLNETLVIFKQHRIYLVTGAGPDNANISGSFGSAELIASDTGCANQRSIVLTPLGLMFQSAKGIYLLDRSFSLKYVGAPVESYNDQIIMAATLLQDVNQIRFLTDDGYTLLYDYLFDQWSTFTNHVGNDAVVWDSTYCYLRTTGVVWEESATDYRDAGTGYSLILETAWIKSTQILQGFQRVRRALVLGEWRSTHVMRASVGYDYEQAWSQPIEWDPATVLNLTTWGSDATWGASTVWGGAGSTVYQFRWGLPRQKCQAVRFRFEDIPGVPAGESFELTELALEIGMKKGLYKLASGRSV